ncbi:MAG TPA: DUF167 domain-containing protein, partial [Microthrixaceae bacterium]|nr:DUF167 domain-containing protein [Microthrixaceae bacterium]HNJ24082.1 DUF167 domain-containing protein [Microthrixaceae bacterium]
DAIDGTFDGVLAVRVSAPPVDGRANEAVRRLLADAFGVARSAVTIVGGHGARRKRVEIDGDEAGLRARLAELADPAS